MYLAHSPTVIRETQISSVVDVRLISGQFCVILNGRVNLDLRAIQIHLTERSPVASFFFEKKCFPFSTIQAIDTQLLYTEIDTCIQNENYNSKKKKKTEHESISCTKFYCQRGKSFRSLHHRLGFSVSLYYTFLKCVSGIFELYVN